MAGSGPRRLPVPERIQGENRMESPYPGVHKNSRSRSQQDYSRCFVSQSTRRTRSRRLLPLLNVRSVKANSGNFMLSSRTLGKFFTIQSLCLEEVRACRVLLRAPWDSQHSCHSIARGILPLTQTIPCWRHPQQKDPLPTLGSGASIN